MRKKNGSLGTRHVSTEYDELKLSIIYETSLGELVKLPGRESRGDAGSNPVGVSNFSRFFYHRFVFVLLYL